MKSFLSFCHVGSGRKLLVINMAAMPLPAEPSDQALKQEHLTIDIHKMFKPNGASHMTETCMCTHVCVWCVVF